MEAIEQSQQLTERKGATILSTGLAMFAMFFGAGNIVFPLALGQFAQGNAFIAVIALILTAVIVPLAGLMAMLLFNGDYNAFFRRVGKIPGFLIVLMILGVIGPFGGIPRCVTISFSTLNAFGLEGMAGVNLTTFSLISCVVIFLFTIRPTKTLNILGYFLTPVLLISLAVIAIKGLFLMPTAPASSHSGLATFGKGLVDGYKTMDLLAAFFFSSVVLLCLRKGKETKEITPAENRKQLQVAAYGSLIAAGLLALVYFAFSAVAAGYSRELSEVAGHEMLGALAYQMLGPYAGLIAGIAVSFAVLTTEVALTIIFAEFLHETIFKKKVSYRLSLVMTLVVAFLVSTLSFEGISAFLGPLLKLCYPALIVLTLLNLCNKLFGFMPVKRFFYGTVLLTFALQLFLN